MHPAERKLSRRTRRQFGVATRSQILGAGFSIGTLKLRIKDHDWVRLLPGVYRIHDGPDWEQRVMAAQLWGEPQGAISHSTAATIWGFLEIRIPVELTLPIRRRSQAFVRTHESALAGGDVASRGRFRLTSPTRTLIDLGATADPDVVEAALEEALRMGLTTLERIEVRLDRVRERGKRGAGVLAGILEARGEVAPAESPLETRFAQFVRGQKLPEPVRQLEMELPNGRKIRLDFAWPDHKVVVEVDGRRYHSGGRAFQLDREKSNALALKGWTLVRITHHDLTKKRGETAALLQDLFSYHRHQGSLEV